MSLKRTLRRTSIKEPAKQKMIKHELKNAFILTEETGINIQKALSELPHKYRMVGPILQLLEQSIRGTVSVDLPFGQEVPQLLIQPPSRLLPKSEQPVEDNPSEDEN